MLRRVRAPELRYYLVQAHYRSLLEYSEEALEEAAAAYQRIERFVVRASEALMGATDDDGAPGLPVSFRSAMDEDLAVPSALAAVHASVRDGNQALAASDKTGRPGQPGPGPCHAGRARPGSARAAVGGFGRAAPAPATGCATSSARW